MGHDTADRNQDENERFRERYVEDIDISDAEGNLYPAYRYEDPEEMPQHLLNRVRKHLEGVPSDAPLRVLEVGCATGFLLRRIRDTYPDADILGIDPSPVSCAKAAAAGTPVEQGTLDSINLGQRRFDLIVILGNLMLHDDPATTLSLARAHLAEGGLLIFDVKNARSAARLIGYLLAVTPWIRDLARARRIAGRAFANLRFAFDRKQVASMARRLGFEIETVRTYPPRALAHRNSHPGSHGLQGTAWRSLDALDRIRDQQAWIELGCRVGVEPSAGGPDWGHPSHRRGSG